MQPCGARALIGLYGEQKLNGPGIVPPPFSSKAILRYFGGVPGGVPRAGQPTKALFKARVWNILLLKISDNVLFCADLPFAEN